MNNTDKLTKDSVVTIEDLGTLLVPQFVEEALEMLESCMRESYSIHEPTRVITRDDVLGWIANNMNGAIAVGYTEDTTLEQLFYFTVGALNALIVGA